eukprot:980912_1
MSSTLHTTIVVIILSSIIVQAASSCVATTYAAHNYSDLYKKGDKINDWVIDNCCTAKIMNGEFGQLKYCKNGEAVWNMYNSEDCSGSINETQAFSDLGSLQATVEYEPANCCATPSPPTTDICGTTSLTTTSSTGAYVSDNGWASISTTNPTATGSIWLDLNGKINIELCGGENRWIGIAFDRTYAVILHIQSPSGEFAVAIYKLNYDDTYSSEEITSEEFSSVHEGYGCFTFQRDAILGTVYNFPDAIYPYPETSVSIEYREGVSWTFGISSWFGGDYATEKVIFKQGPYSPTTTALSAVDRFGVIIGIVLIAGVMIAM